jgi:hypothetical protein
LATTTERFVLKRVEDGLYFQEPPLGSINEWTPQLQDARTWVDIDSCIAAAFTWYRIKGQQLEVHGVTY